MSSVVREVSIAASPDIAWAAVSDVRNVHTRLASGFVTHTEMNDGVRTVKFANGVVICERIVTIYSKSRHVAYGLIGDQSSHHNASIQIFPGNNSSCRLVWATDVLPDTLVPSILSNVESALPIIKASIEAQAS